MASKPKAPVQVSKQTQNKETGGGEKSSLGISFKKESSTFGDWYQDVNSLPPCLKKPKLSWLTLLLSNVKTMQVLKKGDMIDYYDISGCYILKPASYRIWEIIQRELRRSLAVDHVRSPRSCFAH